MVILVGWVFLMSEVSLYWEPFVRKPLFDRRYAEKLEADATRDATRDVETPPEDDRPASGWLSFPRRL